MHFQTVMNRMAERYTKPTISHIRTLYNKMYEKAIDNGLCTENPIIKTELPKNASVRTVMAMTKEEQEAFIQASKTLSMRDQFILMTYLLTGLRLSLIHI